MEHCIKVRFSFSTPAAISRYFKRTVFIFHGFNSGGYAQGPKPAEILRQGILDLCAKLKPEAVALADGLAPPDFILNSVLGMSDGKVTKYDSGTLMLQFLFQS